MPPRKQPLSKEATAPVLATAARPSTRTRVTRTATLQTEELAAKLETKLTISDPKGKQKAVEATAPKTTTACTIAKKTRVVKDVEGTSEVTGLAQELAKGLTLDGGPPERTREEKCTDAMREVNSASKSLSGIVESGWKSSVVPTKAPQRSSTSKQPDFAVAAVQHANSARSALQVLRELKPGDIDVERAASSLVGKLISLELYDTALEALSEGRAFLLRIYRGTPSDGEVVQKTKAYLLSLPLPSASLEDDILLTLTSNYLLYSLFAFSYTTFTTSAAPQTPSLLTHFADSLSNTSTLLQWIPSLKKLSPKHMDSILTRAYTSITKSSALTHCAPLDAKPMYAIRVYALQLLLRTSPSVLRPSTFWDQVVKFTVAFVKDVASGSASAEVKDNATRTILATFEMMKEAVLATRADGDIQGTWLGGSGFVGFCEYWMDFARRANDAALMRRISAHIRSCSPSPSSSDSHSAHTNETKQAATAEATIRESAPNSQQSTKHESIRLSTVLAEATLLVEQLGSPADEDLQRCLTDAASAVEGSKAFLVAVYASGNVAEGDEHRYADKVRRAVERLRRAAVKALETLPTNSQAARRLLRHVVEKGVDVIEAAIYSTKSCNGELFTAALDSLFALARVTLEVSSPLSYTQAYDYLSRAAAFLARAEESACDTLQIANYLRCLSGAFHNLGGTLYQATQHSHAARFLEQSCSVGERALKMYRTTGRVEVEKQETWTQLEDQMYRRWEILGVCHSKTEDRKQAFEAFVSCVKTFPFAKQSFLDMASTHNVSTLFDSISALKHVAGIIDRLTYIGICDLLLEPRAVSLKPHLVGCFVPEGLSLDSAAARKVIIGAVLERQVQSLDGCRWKMSGCKAVKFFLNEALRVYDAKPMPIRRARVVLKQLEYFQSSQSANAQDALDPEALGREADTLLSKQDLGLDSGLVHFRTRYRAILKLRLALLCHREAQTSQFSKVVAYAEEACGILKGALSASSPFKQPRQSVTPAQSPKVTRTRASGRTASKAVPASRLPIARLSRARAAKAIATMPATPKKKRVPSRPNIIVTGTAPLEPEEAQSLPVDDFPVLLGLLRSCSHLLGLLGQVVTKVHLLIVARRICENFLDIRPDDYATISSDLAQEYINLGKLAKAGNVLHGAINLAKRAKLSEETQVLLQLRYAECHAAAGNVLKGSSAYCEAYAASGMLPDIEKGLPTTQRLVLRTTILERAAVAASTFALIQYSRDDPAAAINSLLQALRLWNRAIEMLSKVVPAEPTKAADDDTENPFLEKPTTHGAKTQAKANEKPLSPRKIIPRLPALDGIEWRVSHGLLVTLFALTQAYIARGSPREAEYFAQQAKDVAESLNTPAMVGRALARIGEIYLHLHQVEDSRTSLVKAAELAADTAGPDVAEIRCLRAEHSRRHSDGKHAQQLYDEAMSMLEELDSVFAALDRQAPSPRKSLEGMLSPKSSKVTTNHESLAPSVLMAILRQNIRLLHGEGEEYAALLERFRNLSLTAEAKAEESALLAKLSLENVYTRFQADMFLSSLSESTITLPMGMTRDKARAVATGHDVLAILNNAERLFWSDLGLISRRGAVFDVRDAAISLALIRSFQTSLGGSSADSPVVAARLLDMSAAITLQREVLEATQHKFPDIATQNDLQWPVMTPNGSVMPPPKRKPKARFVPFGSDDEDDGHEDVSEHALKKFWETIGNKYRSRVCDSTSLASPQLELLPRHWTVVSISVTEDRNTMFVTRQRPRREPLIFCIPLKDRRENVDDTEFLTFDDAIAELKEIIRLSDEGTRQAQHVTKDRVSRSAWWADRAALDERMKALLANIEFCWLGAFKTILNDSTDIPGNLLDPFRTQVELAFKRGLRLQDKRQSTAIRLNDALLECFASLSPKCRDEELADLVYFILDLYQFHGMPVAVNEVDIDEVVVDLRTALEEHHARCIGKLRLQKDAHMFLVLDKNVAGVPWESLPILRGRSISRIPSVDFLLDRLEYCQQMKVAGSSAAQGSVDRIVVDPRSTYYVLNPSGDLKNTEGRFLDWLKDMASIGWDGIVGRAPSELQLSNALTGKDLVIYFGHGGAEQYIKSHRLRHLPRCAATMLWGCSSGALKEMGDFDRIGTPYNYMLSGCPTLVANLWDVTDRDIDKFSQAVFDKMHLTQERVAQWRPEKRREDEASIVTAVAESRDACKLKYLTGAAPVVYGIPFYL
ncbi:uncharacterized protein PHACADRAFT_203784 [Phanerochaete carnosa HHB-10118-sp]|uniref:separase n=1 Tax=Phanerochaete carnosa (strain HHB-10118-sp) TaxID=650164 RepID=K5WME3_PHACS|nr:uncharacterized protein PHACADRAFT_203784 [Phanerochaete carnosa HHB-10118-sp]EKM60615.1 hypothetical protein PHACADRAFT_203784 [Phanerochaete carnosa HHB-10118-sp]